MNSALRTLLPRIESWPEEDQQALLDAAREIEAERAGVYAMSKSEEAAVLKGLAEASRGDFATEESLKAMWARFGR